MRRSQARGFFTARLPRSPGQCRTRWSTSLAGRTQRGRRLCTWQEMRHVTLIVRGAALGQTMSDYLIRAIEAAPNISVRYQTEVVDGAGDRRLTQLTLRDRSSRATENIPTSGLFVLIGAEPHTSWLPEAIQRDPWGYLVTGPDLLETSQTKPAWSRSRQPLPFETSIPGVFAVGDVRHGGAKRVAAAVGDGSAAVRLLHEYLAQSAEFGTSQRMKLRNACDECCPPRLGPGARRERVRSGQLSLSFGAIRPVDLERLPVRRGMAYPSIDDPTGWS